MTEIMGTSVRTLVLGLGNKLWGDDGLGIEAAQMLMEMNLPSGVCVEVAGEPGYALAAWLECDPQRLILIDAARMGLAPGSWRRFGAEEVELIARGQVVSLHQASLAGGLAVAEALGVLPEEVCFYAVEPASLEAGEELSPAVKAALPDVIESIYLEIYNHGEKNEPEEDHDH